MRVSTRPRRSDPTRPPPAGRAGTWFAVTAAPPPAGAPVEDLALLPWLPAPQEAAGVPVCASLEQARAWAVYLGRRLDLDAVAVLAVHPTGAPAAEDCRGLPLAPRHRTVRPRAGAVREWVDPWAGCAPRERARERAIPF